MSSQTRRLYLYIFLGCCCYLSKASDEAQIEDISNTTSSCHPLDSCEPLPAEGPVAGRKRSCSCDYLCAVYGDCCRDADAYDADIQRRNSRAHSCVQLVEYGDVYIRAECMEGWQGELEIMKQCDDGLIEVIRQNVALDLPITSLQTGITYANIYCATCNDDISSLARWLPRIQCPRLPHNYSTEEVRKHLHYSEYSGSWEIPYSIGGNDLIVTCEVYPEAPESVILQGLLRQCERTESSCAGNWTDPHTQELCQNHMAMVYDDTGYSDVYRNRFCAICNYIKESDIVCEKPRSRSGYARTLGFDLERFVTNGYSGLLNWDTFIEENLPTEINIYGTNGNGSVELIKRNKDAYTIVVSKLPDDDFRDSFDRTQVKQCIILKNGNKLCDYKDLGASTVVLSIVSFTCLVMSSVCLIIHLVVFMIVPDLKNLSGKNLASYSVALLAADVTLILGYFGEPGDIECFIIAILKYYFFLAAFFWLVIMSTDVCWTIRQSTKQLRLRSGSQRQKFLTYTVCGWLLPIPPLCMAVILDTLDTNYLNGMPLGMIPEFGKLNCWFGQPQALLVFFGAPLGITMLLCTISFIYSARIVYQTKSTVRTSSTGQQKAFMLYIRLAMLSGITWISGLIATCINIVALKYVVVVLNAPQGLFIFLAFTCTTKVRDGLRQKFSCLRCQLSYCCCCCSNMDDKQMLNRKISDTTDQSSGTRSRTTDTSSVHTHRTSV